MIPKALLFDLDGVITDTARFHYLAWKQIADEYGLHFNREDNERLKGVSRQRSFEIILEINDALDRFDAEKRRAIETEKNNVYVELIRQLETKDILPGIPAFLASARRAGLKLAVASASKNAAAILSYLHLEEAFDYVADAGKISRSKPDPEVFLNCAQALGIAPEDCVGIEDSQAGIEAIHAGGMASIGIGVVVTSISPDVVLGSTAELNFEKIFKELGSLNLVPGWPEGRKEREAVAEFVAFEGDLICQRQFEAACNKMYEGIFAQGNGYMHTRGCHEEGFADAPQDELYSRTMKSVTVEKQRHGLSKWGVYIPTIMGKHPALEEVMINLPYFLSIETEIDGERLDMGRAEEYSRSLDMKTGELVRRVVVATAAGNRVELCFRRFASMARKHLYVQSMSLRVLKGTPRVVVRSGIDASVKTNGYDHFAACKLKEAGGGISCRVITDLGFAVTQQTDEAWDLPLEQPSLAEGERRLSRCWQLDLREGDCPRLTKLTAMTSSRDLEEISVDDLLAQARAMGYEALLAESAGVWKTLWRDAKVTLTGDEGLQHALDFSVYHLLRCNTGSDHRAQVCAKGFAGEAYYGRFFWDSEMYLLPFYIYTAPQAARQLILYRYHTLAGARKNAARYGCRGARYPWQSGLDGQEQCSLWEYADNEVHITADVAYGVMHYYRATDDLDFMARYGLEMLLETARFWMDRIDTDEEGRCHLLNVMGPDEYSPMTRDNGFTNRMVQFNLRSACQMAKTVAEKAPRAYEAVAQRLGLREEELRGFEQAADSLPIPYDPARKLYLQSADFEDYAPICLETYWRDRNRAFANFVPQEKLYRTRCIKQADTIALMTLFPQEFTDEEVAAAYDYYLPLTTHDSSLSPAGHTMVANRLHRTRDVKNFLALTEAVDLSIPKRGAEDGIHIANCGFLWQLAVQGFAGVPSACNEEELVLRPNLPEGITSVETRLWWRGKQYHILVTEDGAQVTAVPAGEVDR